MATEPKSQSTEGTAQPSAGCFEPSDPFAEGSADRQMCVAGWSEGSDPWSEWSERNSEGSQPTGEGSDGNSVGSEAWVQPSRGISQSSEPSRATVMECGNASYRSDCLCSSSNPWLVQSRLVARAKAGPARVAGTNKQ
ncbi:MAG: hypothetical protein QOJ98_1128 [Acidobacteriota bacterium]|jgi:hypothetical protein|nr:hypothetical protein [Acidobacteriota bacterium]